MHAVADELLDDVLRLLAIAGDSTVPVSITIPAMVWAVMSCSGIISRSIAPTWVRLLPTRTSVDQITLPALSVA